MLTVLLAYFSASNTAAGRGTSRRTSKITVWEGEHASLFQFLSFSLTWISFRSFLCVVVFIVINCYEDFVTDYGQICEAANGKKQAQVFWATHVQDGYAG